MLGDQVLQNIKGLEVLLLITHPSEDPEEDHSPMRQARERNPVYQAGTWEQSPFYRFVKELEGMPPPGIYLN